MTSPISIHIIAYSPETLAARNEGYQILDNSRNERPDWREYWPIRHFLLNQYLDDNHYYGFFSPRFHEKTGLSRQQVEDFVATSPPDTDAVIFSPQVDVGAFFPNVFVGEDKADPGFLDTSQAFVRAIGLDINLATLLMDTRNVIFSNYIVARPNFWRRWLVLAEQLFEIAEHGLVDDLLRQQLTHPTAYLEGVQRKVFLMERLASLVFATCPNLKVRAYNPFTLAWSTQLNRFRDEAILCDALKIAAQTTGYPEFRNLYESLRQRVISTVLGVNHSARLKTDPLQGAGKGEMLSLLAGGLARIGEIASSADTMVTAYRPDNPDAEWLTLDPSVLVNVDTVLPPGPYDAWVLDNIVETLPDPVRVLRNLRGTLAPRGSLLISFRNAQHWRYQALLAVGEGAGDTDQPPYVGHRFTRTEMFGLLDHCGYRVDAGVMRLYSPEYAERYLPTICAMALCSGGDTESAEQDAKVAQYVLRVVPK